LEGEELSGSVVVLENAFVGGFQNGVVDFFGEIGLFADGDGFEFGEGEFLAGFEFAVDLVDGVFAGEKDEPRQVLLRQIGQIGPREVGSQQQGHSGED
jgi:hypothetical protein